MSLVGVTGNLRRCLTMSEGDLMIIFKKEKKEDVLKTTGWSVYFKLTNYSEKYIQTFQQQKRCLGEVSVDLPKASCARPSGFPSMVKQVV